MGWHLDDATAKRVGAWIAQAREERELTQAMLVNKTGGSVSRLSDIENGRCGPRGWNFQTIRNLERALSVPFGTLQRVADGEDDLTLDQLDVDPGGELAVIQQMLLDLAEKLERRDELIEALDRRVRALGG